MASRKTEKIAVEKEKLTRLIKRRISLLLSCVTRVKMTAKVKSNVLARVNMKESSKEEKNEGPSNMEKVIAKREENLSKKDCLKILKPERSS